VEVYVVFVISVVHLSLVYFQQTFAASSFWDNDEVIVFVVKGSQVSCHSYLVVGFHDITST